MRRKRLLFVWAVTAWILILAGAAYGVTETEYNALFDLYNSTDGANWTDNTGWLIPGTDPCDWYGITCDQAGSVSRIDLDENNLSGTIPASIADIDMLEWLSLHSNQLTGQIPSELGSLQNLENLWLFSNELSGPIPPELGNLIALDHLALGINQLSGPIPSEIGNLTKLSHLTLSHNQLTGTIPSEIWNLIALTDLRLASNQLNGSIPPEIENLIALTDLDLASNQLNGSIPPEIGNLIALTDLSLASNQLGGSIPPELGRLQNLESLWLYSNELSGPIPPEIGNLIALDHLALSRNQLSGPIPSEIGNLTRLLFLSLSNNQLTDPIPPEIGNLASIEEIDIADNNLEGPVPETLMNLTTLLDNESDFRRNKLYTDNEELRLFMNQKQIDGDWMSSQAMTQNNPPATPIITGPLDETVDPDGAVTLNTSPFSDPDGDTHLKTQWIVRRADMPFNAEENSVIDDISDTDLTTHTVSGLTPGLKYLWRAGYEDTGGGGVSWSPASTFKVGTSIPDANVDVPPGDTAADFAMVSFVQWPDNPAAGSVLGAELGGVYDTHQYRIGTYDPLKNGGEYREYGDNLVIDPGKAYWIFARSGMGITVNGVPVSTTEDIEVPLAYNTVTSDGWNMIAPPNAKSYNWADVEVVEYDSEGRILFGPEPVRELAEGNPFIDRRLWRWANGVYASDAQVMQTYAGYWVRALRPNISLRFPAGVTVERTDPDTLLAGMSKKAGRWLERLLPEPTLAVADTGDSPPPPMAGFTGEPVEISGDDSSSGGGACFITECGR